MRMAFRAFRSSFHMFSRKELFFLVAVGVSLLVVINANYLYGFAQSNDEMRFTGLLGNVTDQMTYLSHMEQVRSGSVFLTLLHTAEEVPSKIINLLFLLMGYVSVIFPKLLVYHLFRNILAVGLVFLLYYFLAYFFPRPLHKGIALLFLIFTSGWGVYMALFSSYLPAGILQEAAMFTAYIDFFVPEAHLLSSMYMFPHFLAAIALNLFVYIFLFDYLKTGRRKAVFFAAATGFLLGFVHLYEVITIYAVLTPFLIFRWWQTKNARKYVISFLPFYGITLLPMMYQLWMVLAYPDSYGMLGTTTLVTPPLAAVFMAFGAFSLFVLCFFMAFLKKGNDIVAVFPNQLTDFARQNKEIWIFLLFWIVCNTALLYFPLPPQRRFIQGLQIPVVILGSMTLFYLLVPAFASWLGRRWQGLTTRKALGAIAATLLVIHVASPVWVLAGDYYALAYYQFQVYQPWNYYFIPQKVYKSFEQIAGAGAQGSVLSNSAVGLWIPTLGANRVYHGHTTQTFYREEKEREWQRFLLEEEPAREKYRFLEQYHISYIVYIDEERQKAVFKDPSYLRLMHKNESVEVYQVLHER